MVYYIYIYIIIIAMCTLYSYFYIKQFFVLHALNLHIILLQIIQTGILYYTTLIYLYIYLTRNIHSMLKIANKTLLLLLKCCIIRMTNTLNHHGTELININQYTRSSTSQHHGPATEYTSKSCQIFTFVDGRPLAAVSIMGGTLELSPSIPFPHPM